MEERLKIGDLVEWLESIYPKVHRMNRGIITKSNGTLPVRMFKVVTTDNEAMWVYGTDLRKLEDE